MISIRRGSLDTRTSRLVASVAVGVAVVLGTGGCAMLAPQATTIRYSAAEGVNVYSDGPLQVRNALIVANADGTKGNFVAAVVNETAQSQTLRITFGEGSDTIVKTVRVAARSTVSFGSEETDPLPVEGTIMLPGSDVPGYFVSGDADGTLVSVPILDGTLDYLAPLAP